MAEQERYKRLMKKLIQETEDSKINSTEELVQKIIQELKPGSSFSPDN